MISRLLAAVGALVSAGAVIYGLWMAWPPLGVTAGGLMGLFVTLMWDHSDPAPKMPEGGKGER